ncbi:hypothetical protein GUJ93_ZPchr0014g47141 [Zizania palustris]|uniref:Glycolipid transfer protein domain-containing protein n=1 Tax=Zizania palustris TaxID=103762 RepID=A0A8J5VUT9_ZIZPA|nr:hypothetical protein GUJ93_ZPchr0014g47141 [Zizania palustris]
MDMAAGGGLSRATSRSRGVDANASVGGKGHGFLASFGDMWVKRLHKWHGNRAFNSTLPLSLSHATQQTPNTKGNNNNSPVISNSDEDFRCAATGKCASMVVKRARDERKAASDMDWPWPEGGGGGGEKSEGEKDDASERGGQEEGDKEEVQEEVKRSWSEIRLAIEELSAAAERDCGVGKLAAPSPPPTLPFLALAHLLLQVLDKIGPTMAVLRLDVQRNIERLQELYLLNPSKYSILEEILDKEVQEGTARKVDSCSRAILWLTRSMDFTIALLQRLGEDSDQQSFAQIVEVAYIATLKPWHGWISSAACKIAMKLIPDRKMFVSLLVGKCQDCAALKEEVAKLTKLLLPFLDDIHAMMAKFRLERLKST